MAEPVRKRSHALIALIGLLVSALLLGTETPSPTSPAPPLTGFSYSPLFSQWLNRNPATDLAELLSEVNPDLVRLPIYWETIEPTPSSLDFNAVDELMEVVAEHNRATSRQTRVILAIGARNFVYPELHMPAWAGPREQPELGAAQQAEPYRLYFDASLTRYRSSSLLYAWQVENEPFDYVVNPTTGADQITLDQIRWEVGEVHRLDPGHLAMTTSFDGWNVVVDWLQVNATGVLDALHGYPSGHPGEALDVGDALGLDIYVDAPNTPLRFTTVALRASWKAEALSYWSGLAKVQGKAVWLTEMQAQPWGAASGGFTTNDLLENAAAYRTEPLNVVLLWGVSTWLQDPAWMSAAANATRILQAP